MRVAPHARLARPALEGSRMLYVRVVAPRGHAGQPWRRALLELDLVPLHACGELGTTLFAIAVPAAAALLDDLGFAVDRLGAPGEPRASDLYLLRDDRQVRTGFLAEEGASRAHFASDEEEASVLASSPDGLYVAIPAGLSVEHYHFEEARHGHTEKLLPNPALLSVGDGSPAVTGLTGQAEERALDPQEREALAQVSAESIGAHLARYAGGQSTEPPARAIVSRHILHAHNEVAVEALAADLEAIGEGELEVGLHAFRHEGQTLFNIEAELQGSEPDELVLLTAHLDSTAQFSPGFDPTRDPAPGADDDASGLAGVLSVARTLHGLRRMRPPKRSIRFVLFNAEEHGLVGSKAYARDQAALGARIAAVFQMDMIGYNRAPPRSFEVHAGFLPSVEVQQRSRALAERIGRVATDVSPGLPAPQIYVSDGSHEGDPAEGRSDHASFQLVGYPACATTEDFFAGPGSDPAEPNPHYHMPSDTFVDLDYAADLARAVGAAAWLSAAL
ncbi:MAG: M28 family metallopeptidase [Actinomycetota bacterium]|nr:M28 family metallopeptidase [Actinomycetota bacterium]